MRDEIAAARPEGWRAHLHEIIFEADIHAIAEGTAARVEFELGFAEEMARSLGDGAPNAQSLFEPTRPYALVV